MGTATLDAKMFQHLTDMREAVLLEVLLHLQRAYDDLDRDMCLGIMAAYRVSPRKIRIMKTYWGRLTMVATYGGYFGMPFKGYCGLTQGNPPAPTIFNMVMDAVI